MSDHFQYVMFPSVPQDKVPVVKKRVLEAMWQAGVIGTDTDETLSLGNETEVYPPGRNIGSMLINGYSDFQQLSTRGLAVIEGFGFNGWELNDLSICTCPSCATEISVTNLMNPIMEAASSFHKSGVMPALTCSACSTATHTSQWALLNGLTFTHLGFQFWNWPHFANPTVDDGAIPVWKIDIPGLMEAAAGHPRRTTYGKL